MEVRQLAVDITGESQDKVGAIFDFVKANVAYVPDPIGPSGQEIELFISPVRMVTDYNVGIRIAGDCDDHAILFTALCRAVGIPCSVVLTDTTGGGLDHAYSRVFSKKLRRWICADTASNAPLGWQYSHAQQIIV